MALESGEVQTVLDLMNDRARWDETLEIARDLLSGTLVNPWSDNTVRHYYSPQSMVPLVAFRAGSFRVKRLMFLPFLMIAFDGTKAFCSQTFKTVAEI